MLESCSRGPLHGDNYRRLMRLHYLRADRAAAIAAFDRCERVLNDELSTNPGNETLASLRQIEKARPFLRRCCNGRGDEARVAMIVAEAGLGKTRLLSDIALARRQQLH